MLTPQTKKILERAEPKNKQVFNDWQEGERFTYERLLPVIQALLADNERLAEVLEHAKDFCLCERFKTEGFDYGEEHRFRGKPGSGKRWLTPKDKIMPAVTAHNQTLKELAGDV